MNDTGPFEPQIKALVKLDVAGEKGLSHFEIKSIVAGSLVRRDFATRTRSGALPWSYTYRITDAGRAALAKWAPTAVSDYQAKEAEERARRHKDRRQIVDKFPIPPSIVAAIGPDGVELLREALADWRAY